MNELKDYLNSNRTRTITLDLNELVDRAIKYWDYISELVEKKSNKKLLVPSGSNINTNDINDTFVYLEWNIGSLYLTMEIYEDYDCVTYYYWDENGRTNWCHNDHRIGTELDSYVLETLLLFTEDK